jgi:hypothetical protein
VNLTDGVYLFWKYWRLYGTLFTHPYSLPGGNQNPILIGELGRFYEYDVQDTNSN